jgi:hypothetical protein
MCTPHTHIHIGIYEEGGEEKEEGGVEEEKKGWCKDKHVVNPNP